MTTILHLIDLNCQHSPGRSHGVMLSGAKGRVDRFECQKQEGRITSWSITITSVMTKQVGELDDTA